VAFAFAALREPRPQAFGEAFRSEAEAGFDFAGAMGSVSSKSAELVKLRMQN